MDNFPQGLFGLVTAIIVTAMLIAVVEQSLACLAIVLFAVLFGCSAASIICRK